MFSWLVALVMNGTGMQEPRPALLKDVSTIVMMGDSITQIGASPKGYVTLVTQSLDHAFGPGAIKVVNAGISGEKAPDMHARFQRDVLDRHPQLVTLSVG